MALRTENLDMEELTDGLIAHFEEKGYHDLAVELSSNSANTIEIYLDLPSTGNYDNTLKSLEKFFGSNKCQYHIEDFDIDGDYEGQISVIYNGE